MSLFERFFAPRGQYPPCEMFTLTHFIVLAICLIGVGFAIYFTRYIKKDQILFITRLFAIVLTFLEIVKIVYNFYYECFALDFWVPLSFCSLFIYALWMSGFGKGIIKKTGETFIACGCSVAGLSFLIMPSTSLTEVPMFHFLSCYSMLYHSLMLFFGLLYLSKKIVIVSRASFKYFSVYVIIAGIVSIILNSIFDANLMFLARPYHIPIWFLEPLSKNIPILYSALILFVCILAPYFISYGLSKLFSKEKCKKKQEEINYV